MTTFGRLATFIVVGVIGLVAFNREQTVDISNIEVIHELPDVVWVEPTDFLVQIDREEFECMRTNMYYEARNQKTDAAYIAVGYTVLNRVESKRYPDSVCDVVQQAVVIPRVIPFGTSVSSRGTAMVSRMSRT